MLRSDENILSVLVEKYTLQEVIDTLAQIAEERAHNLSDAYMKEKAVDMYDNSVILSSLVLK